MITGKTRNMYSELTFFTACLVCLWQASEAYYARNTNTRMKHKIMAMDRDLIYDSVSKRASIDWMKRYYDKSHEFHFAEVIYSIKRKYSRMIFAYMKTVDNYDELWFEPILKFLSEIQHIAMDIDDMIQMLEEWEDRNTRKKRITRTGKETQLQEDTTQGKAGGIQKQKQRNYVERKKILLSMAQGNSRYNISKENFKKRNRIIEGFESDLYFY